MWFGRTFTNRLFEKVVRWKNEKKKKKKNRGSWST